MPKNQALCVCLRRRQRKVHCCQGVVPIYSFRVLFASLPSGWETKTGRTAWPRMGNRRKRSFLKTQRPIASSGIEPGGYILLFAVYIEHINRRQAICLRDKKKSQRYKLHIQQIKTIRIYNKCPNIEPSLQKYLQLNIFLAFFCIEYRE